MNFLPDVVSCKNEMFYLKKIIPLDAEYIWKNAPLKQLFFVTGHEAENVQELIELFQLDWTVWYLIIDHNGFSYGLVRAIPEMDNTISLHGIGWTQNHKSPRIFVMAWHAMHQYLFDRGSTIIKTYCDKVNTNAIRFICKTGYQYEYTMPSGNANNQTLHFTLNNDDFITLQNKKQFTFQLNSHNYNDIKIPNLIEGSTYTDRAKQTIFSTALIEMTQLDNFKRTHSNKKFFYFYHLIPSPKTYTIFLKRTNIASLLISEINGQYKIVIFDAIDLPLNLSLDLVKFIKETFSLKTNDVIIVDDNLSLDGIFQALTISFRYCGSYNHQAPNIWTIIY